MNFEPVHSFEIAFVAFIFSISVFSLARREKLTFRYTFGWLALSATSAIGGLMLPIIEPIAKKFKLEAFSFVSAIAIMVLLALCIQLSISISTLQRKMSRINEELALQNERLESHNDSKK